MPKIKLSFIKIATLGILILTAYFTFSPNSHTAYAAKTFPGASQYTVVSGDTLYLIAQKCNVSIDVLRVVNGLESDMITPGQILNLPANTSTIFSRYTIKSGDSLYIIASKHGISVDSLMTANELSSDLIMPGNVLTIPYMQFNSLKNIMAEKGVAGEKIDIFIDKSEHTLLLFSKGVWLKTYHVEMGSSGLGDKEVRGDLKTPEGTFTITERSIITPVSVDVGSRWLRLGYPNKEDAYRGLISGLIDQKTYNDIVAATNNGSTPPQLTALGGAIGIHGGTTPQIGSNWTWGCIGLYNRDVEDFFDLVNVGTRVVIQK